MFEAVQRYRGIYLGRERTFPGLRERETQIFGLSALAFIVHRFDDSFINMNPGTSAGDHLVSGGVPIAIVLATLLAWPVLTSGLRAIVALVLGILAVGMGGVTSGIHIVLEGPTGSDWSGLLSMAAGGVLLGLGVWLTHRSIAKPARRNWRWLGKRVGAGLAGLATMIYLIVPVVYATLITDFPRTAVCCETPADYGLAYEDVTFRSSDGLLLDGWYIPSRNGAAVIAVAGAFNTRMGVIKHAAMLGQHGYGVLLYDMRGKGESEGDPHILGWGAQPDVTGALDFLLTRPEVDPDRIGALGLSLGAEVLLEAAAHDERIRAVVADGPGARTLGETQLTESGPEFWPATPFLWLNLEAAGLLAGESEPEHLDHLIPQIAPRAVFLIASGTAEEPAINQIYFEAAGEPKTLWEIPESHHIKGIKTVPDEYERRVVGFFDAELLGR